MDRAAQSEIIDTAKTYLVQQATIYGDLYAANWSMADNSAPTRSQSPLGSLWQEKKNCTACGLAKSRSNVVFGVGPENAKVMCIGEAPGADEDYKGEPFQGEAGQLLDKILAAIGFKRDEIYLSSIVKCHPPDGRTPGPTEISACSTILDRQIELIDPVLILLLGQVPAQTLLANNAPLASLRGSAHKVGSATAIVSHAPAALLASQELKREAWRDIQTFRKLYDELVGDKPALNLP